MDGLHLVLLMLALACAYGWWATWSDQRRSYEKGFVAGHTEGAFKMARASTPDDVRDLTDQPYDWAKEGGL